MLKLLILFFKILIKISFMQKVFEFGTPSIVKKLSIYLL